MGNFIRDFTVKSVAYAFAAQRHGTVIVLYSWEHGKLIKTYRVKY